MPRKKIETADATVTPAPKRRTVKTAKPHSNGHASIVVPAPTYSEIAEAAYLRYLSRGGANGSDFDDWVAAERDLTSKLM